MKPNNYKELKEKYEETFPFGSFAGSSVRAGEMWNFILKEVIPMAEKKGREEAIDFAKKLNRLLKGKK